jgi:8-oxo-dGTP pyrophosphatase MutT (NUDIX family)
VTARASGGAGASGGVGSSRATGATRPAWLDTLGGTPPGDLPDYFRSFPSPAEPRRSSAVLILFGPTGESAPGADGVDGVGVVLTERSARLRSHAGQVSFPGGGIDDGDEGPVGAALRESEEEIGLDRTSVDIVATLPSLYLSPSGNSVSPVVGWWHTPGPIGVVDPREVAHVIHAPLADLLHADNRFTVVGPTGFVAPGFEAGGLFVWGFTAMLLNAVFEASGLTRPWDETRKRGIPRGMGPSARDVARYVANRALGR